MAQSATQETTGATRIKGPFIVTMRGAGSTGHDYKFGSAGPVGAGIDVALRLQVPTGQTADVLEIEKPDGTIIYAIDASGNVRTSAATNVVSVKKQVTLTAAQIITLNSVPAVLIAAPGTGKALYVRSCVFQFKYGTVQMTGGGAVNPVYAAATTNLLSGSVAAATIQAAASATISCGSEASALSLTTNVGVNLRAATADFAAGDSTAVVTIWYDVITLS